MATTLSPQIIKKLGGRTRTRHEQVVPGPRAGHIEQVPFRVVDLFQISIVADRFNPLLRRDYFVIAGHYRHTPEFEALGEVHGADGDAAAHGVRPGNANEGDST